MKKETINTFSSGLNYDLNPIMTPNNLLTECLNGTSITFNGDELAIQNDSGNTKIKATNWTEENPEYVQLTEGFYPIGVKEFGGVLYIVSGKSPDSTLWSNSASYNLGEFVHDANKRYYKSLVDNNTSILPSISSSSWEVIGSWNLFVNTYGQIEFGSYPSPQILTEESKGNGISYLFNNPTKDSLFTSNVLNDNVFKSGEYATFSGISTDTDNISRLRYSDNQYISTEYRVYKVKLYLQLTNGFIDLTNDVWNEYARFKGGNLNSQFWFNDSGFKYYCKSNFKGKLVVSVELEDLPEFKLNYYTVDQEDSTGYVLTFNISFTNTTTWNIQEIQIAYSLDGLNQTPIIQTAVHGTSNYTVTLPFSNEGKTFDFAITPIFNNPGTTTNITSELPTIYLEKYTITGSELLSTYFDYDVNDPLDGYALEDYY